MIMNSTDRDSALLRRKFSRIWGVKTLGLLVVWSVMHGDVAYVTQQAIDIDPKIPLIASASRLRL